MRKTSTWHDNLNNVIRDVFFQDEELLDLMVIDIKDRKNILKFIDKYFVKAVVSDEIVTDEKVRICYHEEEGRSIGSNMTKKYLHFDIFVKDEYQHNYGDDMLQSRTELIAEKIKELLTDSKYVCRINFTFMDSYDLYTKTMGYKRYRISFSYKVSF